MLLIAHYIYLSIILQTKSPHVEYYLQWCYILLFHYQSLLSTDYLTYIEVLRSLIRIITQYEKDYVHFADKNQFMMEFISIQIQMHNQNKHVVEEDSERLIEELE